MHLGADGRDEQRDCSERQTEHELSPLCRGSFVVAADQRCELPGRWDGDQTSQYERRVVRGSGGLGLPQLLFLRSRSTNWISLIVSS